MKIDFTVDIQKAMRDLSAAHQRMVPAAASSALNRVATSARTTAVRTIRGETAIKASEVRKYISLRRASRANLVAQITTKSHAPNLIRYGAREVKKGVSANAWGKRRIYRDAFIGNAGRTVFSRVNPAPATGKRRRIGQHQRRAHSRNRGGTTFLVQAHVVGTGPRAKKTRIKALFGPSIRREFIRDKCNQAMMAVINSRWPVEFAREVKWRLDRAMSRA